MFHIRAAIPGDLAFVAQTWLDNYRDSAVANSLSGLYTRRWREVIQMLLGRAQVSIAYDDDMPQVIIGFLVFEHGTPDVVHYIYVRREFRRKHVAHDLFHQVDRSFVYTHRTADAQRLTNLMLLAHLHDAAKPKGVYDFTRIWTTHE